MRPARRRGASRRRCSSDRLTSVLCPRRPSRRCPPSLPPTAGAAGPSSPIGISARAGSGIGVVEDHGPAPPIGLDPPDPEGLQGGDEALALLVGQWPVE